MKPKALFNWSSGKDSSLALYKILKEDQFEVTTLLTSINKEFQRISMHGVHVSLLEKQAESLGFPLIKMEIPKEPSMEEYSEIMSKTMNDIKSQGITHSIFGDIFLEDLRKYRRPITIHRNEGSFSVMETKYNRPHQRVFKFRL